MALINLTPHAVTIFLSDTESVTVPSAGELRLASTPGTVKDARPLLVDGRAVPVIGAQEFTGLDEQCAGIAKFRACSSRDSVLVSLPVATWLRQNYLAPPHGITVYTPGTGPATVVRNDKGQIVGVKALEFHGVM